MDPQLWIDLVPNLPADCRLTLALFAAGERVYRIRVRPAGQEALPVPRGDPEGPYWVILAGNRAAVPEGLPWPVYRGWELEHLAALDPDTRRLVMLVKELFLGTLEPPC